MASCDQIQRRLIHIPNTTGQQSKFVAILEQYRLSLSTSLLLLPGAILINHIDAMQVKVQHTASSPKLSPKKMKAAAEATAYAHVAALERA